MKNTILNKIKSQIDLWDRNWSIDRIWNRNCPFQFEIQSVLVNRFNFPSTTCFYHFNFLPHLIKWILSLTHWLAFSDSMERKLRLMKKKKQDGKSNITDKKMYYIQRKLVKINEWSEKKKRREKVLCVIVRFEKKKWSPKI